MERFRAAGGTHLFLATQNYEGSVPTTLEQYRRQFETTVDLAHQSHAATGVVVYPVLAPYPIDLVGTSGAIGVAAAIDLQRAALDLAGGYVRERRAVALGEVGRPHFPVSPDLQAAGTEVFGHALVVAREVGCPVVVHSADLDAEGYAALGAEARKAGLTADRVVKHYSRHRVDPSGATGVVPSYLAQRELVRDVASDPAPWFLETDFLDDPARPGAVLDLTTVPRRAQALSEGDATAGERLWNPFVRSVERVYGWRPEVEGGTAP